MRLNQYKQFREEYPGTFIVLDSAGGVGKSTQVDVLTRHIADLGYDVEQVSIPRYTAGPWGLLIDDYLKGKLGITNSVHYKLASALYAGDRLEFSPVLRKKLKQGKVIVASRYVASNMAYQGAKIEDPEELTAFLDWLTNFEYEHNAIPVEDMLIVQYAPASVSMSQIYMRQQKSGEGADGHESSVAHIDRVSNLYCELASVYADWFIVNCHDKRRNTLLPVNQTAEEIWGLVEPVLVRKNH